MNNRIATEQDKHRSPIEEFHKTLESPVLPPMPKGDTDLTTVWDSIKALEESSKGFQWAIDQLNKQYHELADADSQIVKPFAKIGGRKLLIALGGLLSGIGTTVGGLQASNQEAIYTGIALAIASIVGYLTSQGYVDGQEAKAKANRPVVINQITPPLPTKPFTKY